MDNNHRLIWIGGKIVPVAEATVNVLSPTSQFGANVFEGIRCYWSEQDQQLYAFRLTDHYKRLQNSIKLLRFNSPYSTSDFQQGLMDVVKANDYREDIAVRQTVFVDGIGGTWNSCEPINMFIAPIAKAFLKIRDKAGLRCQVSSWERISDRNLSPRAKVGANYINSRHYQEALNVLDNIEDHSAVWYYYSAVAHAGMGDHAQALDHARTAASMEPDNYTYQNLVTQLQSGTRWYQEQQKGYVQTYDSGQWCVRLCLLNIALNMCCGGGGLCCGRYPY